MYIHGVINTSPNNYPLYILYRNKSIRVFIAGDYELVCKMYGISGASGITKIKLFFLRLGGGDLNYFNVHSPPFFSIPLNQVIIVINNYVDNS